MAKDSIRIFCSGRFCFDCRMAEYRDLACRDYRARLLGDVNKLFYPQPSYAAS